MYYCQRVHKCGVWKRKLPRSENRESRRLCKDLLVKLTSQFVCGCTYLVCMPVDRVTIPAPCTVYLRGPQTNRYHVSVVPCRCSCAGSEHMGTWSGTKVQLGLGERTEASSAVEIPT